MRKLTVSLNIILFLGCFAHAQTTKLTLTSGEIYSRVELDTVDGDQLHFHSSGRWNEYSLSTIIPVNEIRVIQQTERKPYGFDPVITGFLCGMAGFTTGLLIDILIGSRAGSSAMMIGGIILGYTHADKLSKKVAVTYNLNGVEKEMKARVFRSVIQGTPLSYVKTKIGLERMKTLGVVSFGINRIISTEEDEESDEGGRKGLLSLFGSLLQGGGFSVRGRTLVDTCYQSFIKQMEDINNFNFLPIETIANNENYQQLKGGFWFGSSEGMEFTAPGGLKILPLSDTIAKAAADEFDADGFMLVRSGCDIGTRSVEIGGFSSGRAFARVIMVIELYDQDGERIWDDTILATSDHSTESFMGVVNESVMNELFIETFVELGKSVAESFESFRN